MFLISRINPNTDGREYWAEWGGQFCWTDRKDLGIVYTAADAPHSLRAVLACPGTQGAELIPVK